MAIFGAMFLHAGGAPGVYIGIGTAGEVHEQAEALGPYHFGGFEESRGVAHQDGIRGVQIGEGEIVPTVGDGDEAVALLGEDA
jgi:hypothetical protein